MTDSRHGVTSPELPSLKHGAAGILLSFLKQKIKDILFKYMMHFNNYQYFKEE